MIGIIVSGGIAFIFVLLSTYLGVNYFKSKSIGQAIQEELEFHNHKKGTPTMGGIFIILGTLIGYFLSHINFWTIGKGFKVELIDVNLEVVNLLIIASLMGLVGFIDIAANYFYSLGYETQFYFFSGLGFEIGFFKWFLIVFLLIGVTNSVNFTDGLDGLVGGSSVLTFGGMLIISFWIYRHTGYYSNFVPDSFLLVDVSRLISAAAGSCLAFLWWNTYPAKIIMGDIGSHFIGSLIPLILFALGADGLIFFFCFIFIIEGVSVVLQILSFKYRKKRIFKMAPIHHHFEMKNWAETTIIVRFWIINGIAIVFGLGLFYADYILFGQ
jgi:phospho-N-acetylmuramoyl-pentapeptide-transferase